MSEFLGILRKEKKYVMKYFQKQLGIQVTFPLHSFQELLGLESLSTKILLPLSTMVHAYCRVIPECAEVAEVKAVINELERNLRGGCNVDQKNFRKVNVP